MNKRIQLFYVFLIFIVSACGGGRNLVASDSAASQNEFEIIAKERFGDNYKTSLNSKKTLILCFKTVKKSNVNPDQLYEFFVYDKISKIVIVSKKISNAKASWHDEHNLKIVKRRGIIVDGFDSGKRSYLLDVFTDKRTQLQKSNHR